MILLLTLLCSSATYGTTCRRPGTRRGQNRRIMGLLHSAPLGEFTWTSFIATPSGVPPDLSHSLGGRLSMRYPRLAAVKDYGAPSMYLITCRWMNSHLPRQ